MAVYQNTGIRQASHKSRKRSSIMWWMVFNICLMNFGCPCELKVESTFLSLCVNS